GWQQFVITAIDGPDAKTKRGDSAEEQDEFQASVMDRYVARGPMFDDDGIELIGSFMIMEYPDRAACDEFWAGEPLNSGGVFEEVRIERWRYGKAIG
ncbi:MAG: YciI family protein, partial [Planctomycetota bacterium]|nr:YciI family protein [Planctomycetota bacterium]